MGTSQPRLLEFSITHLRNSHAGPIALSTPRASAMKQTIGQIALVVRNYEEAINFYVGTLGFTLVEDTCYPDEDKRWVIVAPPRSTGSRLLLARAANEE